MHDTKNILVACIVQNDYRKWVNLFFFSWELKLKEREGEAEEEEEK